MAYHFDENNFEETCMLPAPRRLIFRVDVQVPSDSAVPSEVAGRHFFWYYAASEAGPSLSAASTARWSHIFQTIDKNGDGKIGRAEVVQACRENEEVRALLGLLDGVGDSFKTVTLTTGSNGVVNLAQVGGPGGLGTLTVNAGTINLGSNLTLLKDLNLTADQTLLAGDTQMSALAFRLLTDIDSAGAAASLTLEDAITTLIQGRLGGNSPLSTFTSSDVGSTTLTGGVFSDGLALFRNAVIVSGDATVQSFGADANAGIRFLDLVDGTNAP